MALHQSPSKKLHLLREMIRIRRIEQRCAKEYCLGSMAGWLTGNTSGWDTVFKTKPHDIDSLALFRHSESTSKKNPEGIHLEIESLQSRECPEGVRRVPKFRLGTKLRCYLSAGYSP
ncbi:MAG: 3-deoxy-D-arabino-heptulosonate 7-phosphate (DAHP) synthase class II [Paracoccaceae bacterium]|jgi:3-deoxy-D-arabino-heptulosonate 7-phosphate (DAHP) synthase class II